MKALVSADYRCGLDGNFDGPELNDWRTHVSSDLGRLKRQFAKVAVREVGKLMAVRFSDRGTWAIIAHPLWDPDRPIGLLAEAIAALETERSAFTIVDSFNLSRRPITIREAVQGGA